MIRVTLCDHHLNVSCIQVARNVDNAYVRSSTNQLFCVKTLHIPYMHRSLAGMNGIVSAPPCTGASAAVNIFPHNAIYISIYTIRHDNRLVILMLNKSDFIVTSCESIGI